MVKPALPKGMRDLLPEGLRVRRWALEVLRETFERFGFEPLETPALEYAETLEGKYGEEERLIYKFQDRGGRWLALRYDLTVPLCRVVAAHPELPRPWRRYQIAPVWRAEKPQRGRFREFWQCDADIVGTASPLADAELLALTSEGLRGLGFRDFRIRVNDRGMLAALAAHVGLEGDAFVQMCRALDKWDKVGPLGVAEEMQRRGIPSEVAQRVLELVELPLEEMARELGDAPLGRLRRVLELARELGATGLAFDPRLARGLDYYTGIIFEAGVEGGAGSVCGGGRYDGLLGLFGRGMPAAGVSFGLDRLLEAVEAPSLPPPAEVLVATFEGMEAEALRVARRLREDGLRVELFPEALELRRQLSHAARRGIPLVVLVGPEEWAHGAVVLRSMERREQVEVRLEELGARVHRMLNERAAAR